MQHTNLVFTLGKSVAAPTTAGWQKVVITLIKNVTFFYNFQRQKHLFLSLSARSLITHVQPTDFKVVTSVCNCGIPCTIINQLNVIASQK
jgi:hypothetical protein